MVVGTVSLVQKGYPTQQIQAMHPDEAPTQSVYLNGGDKCSHVCSSHAATLLDWWWGTVSLAQKRPPHTPNLAHAAPHSHFT